MQLRQLQHLVALADQGSFGRAAQAVHLSQPALSRSIENLEESLQARLVDLTNNNRRLVAAIVPRDGSYWFYKLRGDLAAVTSERDAFVAFVKSKP